MRGDAAAALAGLHEAADLGHLCVNGAGEPPAPDQVVEAAEDAAAHVHLLDMVDAGAALDVVDVEPGVEAPGGAWSARIHSVRRG